MHSKKFSIRFSEKDLNFLQSYGEGITQQLEKALERLRLLEQNQEQLKTTADQRTQRSLNILKEKERIKTEARLQRQRLRPPQNPHVDWGDSYVDTFDLGDEF